MKKQTGITLIALIITIIVMLILVGVTINVALNGGLIEKARTAGEQTQRETDKEQLLSAVIETVDNNGDFHLEQIKLPDGFTESNGIYTGPTGKQYIINATTGKVEDYTETNLGGKSGEETEPVTPEPQVEVDDLIPTEKQLAEAEPLETGVYGFDDEGTIVYANLSEVKSVSVYYNNVEYVWFCDDDSAQATGYEKSCTWYDKDTHQETSPSGVHLSDFGNPRNDNGYIDRIIASFGV